MFRFLLGLFLVSTTHLCGAIRGEFLSSTSWLADHLRDADLVILHVGSSQDYETGHIPGARLVTPADISTSGERGLRLQLPPADTLRAAFGRLGISDRSRIVVYPATGSVQSATRVWFTLDYLGMGERASLLDGGLGLWKSEGRPVTSEATAAEPGRLTGSPRPEVVVTAEWVAAHLKDPGVRMVDARLPEFYTGSNAGNMPRAGHIPGATNAPFQGFLDERMRFLAPGALAELLEKAGAVRGKSVVPYCHTGMQASVVYFVARYLGLEPKLYDGSFEDWSAQSSLPIETIVTP